MTLQTILTQGREEFHILCEKHEDFGGWDVPYEGTRTDRQEAWIAQHQADILAGVREEIEKVKKHYRKTENYDGNDIYSAEKHYGISAHDWVEIVRLEDGAVGALDDLLAALSMGDKKPS